MVLTWHPRVPAFMCPLLDATGGELLAVAYPDAGLAQLYRR
jgi:hypothetical protein